MVEIMFGNSEAGAMKFARKSLKSLGNDVICLAFMLDCGKLSGSVTGEYRAKLLYNLLYQKQWGADSEMKRELQGLGEVYSAELEKLRTALNHGKPVRIWYSGAPYSMCGFLWLCDMLLGCESAVYAVELPRFIEKDGNIISYSSWGEIEPYQFGELVELERRLSAAEIRKRAFEWRRLKTENAPLRAVVNGSVISVPANFYDFLIFKYLGSEPIREAILIGKLLGENQLGTGDWWYALRIERLIAKKRIIVIENSDKKYQRIICRNADEKAY